tara:strand:+ start:420 stop:1322 length:903 start_codon:yes stop_codon:yes gene_type:complete
MIALSYLTLLTPNKYLLLVSQIALLSANFDMTVYYDFKSSHDTVQQIKTVGNKHLRMVAIPSGSLLDNYKFVLAETFSRHNYSVILEDDIILHMPIAHRFFKWGQKIMLHNPDIWVISTWSGHNVFYKDRFFVNKIGFGGLGWMTSRSKAHQMLNILNNCNRPWDYCLNIGMAKKQYKSIFSVPSMSTHLPESASNSRVTWNELFLPYNRSQTKTNFAYPNLFSDSSYKKELCQKMHLSNITYVSGVKNIYDKEWNKCGTWPCLSMNNHATDVYELVQTRLSENGVFYIASTLSSWKSWC